MKRIVIVAAMVVVAVCANTLAEDNPAGKLLETLKTQIATSDLAKDKVRKFASDVCLPLCSDPALVDPTKAQNGRKVSLDEIKKIDKEWMAAEEELPLQKEKTSNTCAKAIRDIVRKNPAIVEAFAMDDQGAIVGESNLTSDYWQGDEAKWQKSYNQGKGGVDVGKESFDKSANTVIQQVSLPLVDSEGKVVGGVTFGLDISKL